MLDILDSFIYRTVFFTHCLSPWGYPVPVVSCILLRYNTSFTWSKNTAAGVARTPLCELFSNLCCYSRDVLEQSPKPKTEALSLRPKYSITYTRPPYLNEPVVCSRENVLPRSVELDAEHGVDPVPVGRDEGPHSLVEEVRRSPGQRDAADGPPAEPASPRSSVGQNRRHGLHLSRREERKKTDLQPREQGTRWE